MPPLQNEDSSSISLHSTITVVDTTVVPEGKKESSSSKISFGTVGVRTFNREVGDHPDCKVGPPVTIGWEFLEHDPVSLDEYESSHKRRANLRLTSITRKNLLRNVFGVPEEEIRLAEKEVQKILKQRSATKNQGKTSEKAELVVQSARRKLKRMFSKERLWKGVIESTSFLPMVVSSS